MVNWITVPALMELTDMNMNRTWTEVKNNKYKQKLWMDYILEIVE